MITVINRIILALSFQKRAGASESSTIVLPVFLFGALILMALFCLSQGINIFGE